MLQVAATLTRMCKRSGKGITNNFSISDQACGK